MSSAGFERAKTSSVGRWEVTDTELGRGAKGHVVYGHCRDTGVQVAIKKLPLLNIERREREELRREVELLKNLEHPNIVRYVDAKQTGNHLYIVMELMEAGSIYSLLRAHGAFAEPLTGAVLREMLTGLQHLHQHGIVHMDVKAGNVLVSRKTASVKIADFGVSFTDKSAADAPVAGSPYWMAPEVIQMRAPSYASDVWSAGCTTYEMATGHPPHHARAPASAMFHVVQEDTPPQLPQEASQGLRDMLLVCFRSHAEDRPEPAEVAAHAWVVAAVAAFEGAGLSFARPWAELTDTLGDSRARRSDEAAELEAACAAAADGILAAADAAAAGGSEDEAEAAVKAGAEELCALVGAGQIPDVERYDVSAVQLPYSTTPLFREPGGGACACVCEVRAWCIGSGGGGACFLRLLAALAQHSEADAANAVTCLVQGRPQRADDDGPACSAPCCFLDLLQPFVTPESAPRVSALLTILNAYGIGVDCVCDDDAAAQGSTDDPGSSSAAPVAATATQGSPRSSVGCAATDGVFAALLELWRDSGDTAAAAATATTADVGSGGGGGGGGTGTVRTVALSCPTMLQHLTRTATLLALRATREKLFFTSLCVCRNRTAVRCLDALELLCSALGRLRREGGTGSAVPVAASTPQRVAATAQFSFGSWMDAQHTNSLARMTLLAEAAAASLLSLLLLGCRAGLACGDQAACRLPDVLLRASALMLRATLPETTRVQALAVLEALLTSACPCRVPPDVSAQVSANLFSFALEGAKAPDAVELVLRLARVLAERARRLGSPTCVVSTAPGGRVGRSREIMALLTAETHAYRTVRDCAVPLVLHYAQLDDANAGDALVFYRRLLDDAGMRADVKGAVLVCLTRWIRGGSDVADFVVEGGLASAVGAAVTQLFAPAAAPDSLLRGDAAAAAAAAAAASNAAAHAGVALEMSPVSSSPDASPPAAEGGAASFEEASASAETVVQALIDLVSCSTRVARVVAATEGMADWLAALAASRDEDTVAGVLQLALRLYTALDAPLTYAAHDELFLRVEKLTVHANATIADHADSLLTAFLECGQYGL